MNMPEFSQKLQDVASPVIAKLSEQLGKEQQILVIAASHLDMDLLPQLYNHLNILGFTNTLNVLLYTRGGDVNATRRIALLLNDYCHNLNIIAPHYCQSSGTLLALSANAVYFSPLSIFSAIDPHLHGGQGDQNAALSSADIKLFSDMSKDWFNTEVADKSNMLSMLCEHIFPPTLTTFYRTVLEVKEIAQELLKLAGQHCKTTQSKIIDTLMFSYHSHDYAITGTQLAKLDLPFKTDLRINAATWPLVEFFSLHVGGGNRNELNESWCDSIIVCEKSCSSRWKDMSGLNPKWSTYEEDK